MWVFISARSDKSKKESINLKKIIPESKPEKRAVLMRFSDDGPWYVKDLIRHKYVLRRKARGWCDDVRHALNETGNPTPRARELARRWILDEEYHDE